MTRLTPPQPNEVFWDRHSDPDGHVALTASARAVPVDGHLTIRARVSFGPTEAIVEAIREQRGPLPEPTSATLADDLHPTPPATT